MPHTDVKTRRRRTRLTAAGAIVAAMLLSGCASDGAMQRNEKPKDVKEWIGKTKQVNLQQPNATENHAQ